jgi:hypothetical protein
MLQYKQKQVQQAHLNDQATVLTNKVKEGKAQLKILQSEEVGWERPISYSRILIERTFE